MAKIDLNGITVEEINRNSNTAFAASITSGEIFRVTCRHSKNNNILLAIEGKALNCKSFDGGSFTAEGCILYNPPLVRAIVESCDDSTDSLFIINGAVSKTAPASKPSTDTVEELKIDKKPLKKALKNVSTL